MLRPPPIPAPPHNPPVASCLQNPQHFPVKLPPKPTAALLEHQPFLKGVPWLQLERLADLASYAEFPADAVIFGEDGEATAFYLLLSGKVALLAANARQEVTTLQVLEAGDALGWSWAFPPNRWSFSAVAQEPVTALAFSAVQMRLLCDDDPVLGCIVFRRIAQVLLQRLTATRRRLAVAELAAAGIPLRISVAVPNGATPPA